MESAGSYSLDLHDLHFHGHSIDMYYLSYDFVLFIRMIMLWRTSTGNIPYRFQVAIMTYVSVNLRVVPLESTP